MQNCVDGWLKAYEVQAYVRYAIVDKAIGKAVGTIEMFGMVGLFKTQRGILRLDICSEYENLSYIKELISLCTRDFFILFGADEIMTKAVTTAEARISALLHMGFQKLDKDYFILSNNFGTTQ